MTPSRIVLLVLAFGVGWTTHYLTAPSAEPASSVMTQATAATEAFEWGTFYTYFTDETYGMKDLLSGIAVIKPGWEIHPPHQHAEEEFLMVTQGTGTWTVNGKSFEAKPGDLLYAYPWEWHGVKNTGEEPLTFVVFKWNNQGVAVPEQPED